MTPNKYPELPIVPYQKTSANITEVAAYIKSLDTYIAVKIAVYTVFCNESNFGKSGVNNNYAGIQADNSRWGDEISKLAIGTTEVKENMTGKMRRFLVFPDFKASIIFLSERLKARGLYVGGTPYKYYFSKIDEVYEWVLAYWREWVTGSKTANPPQDEKDYLLSIYRKGKSIMNS